MLCSTVEQCLQDVADEFVYLTKPQVVTNKSHKCDFSAFLALLEHFGYAIPESLRECGRSNQGGWALNTLNYKCSRFKAYLDDAMFLEHSSKYYVLHLFLRCAACGKPVDCLAFDFQGGVRYFCAQCTAVVFCRAYDLNEVLVVCLAVFFDDVRSKLHKLRNEGRITGIYATHTHYLSYLGVDAECARITNKFLLFSCENRYIIVEDSYIRDAEQKFEAIMTQFYRPLCALHEQLDLSLNVTDVLFGYQRPWIYADYGCVYQLDGRWKLGFYIEYYAKDLVVIQDQESKAFYLLEIKNTLLLYMCSNPPSCATCHRSLFSIQGKRVTEVVHDVTGAARSDFYVHFLHIFYNTCFLLCASTETAFLIPLDSLFTRSDLEAHTRLYRNFDIANIYHILPDLLLPQFYADRVDELLKYYLPMAGIYKAIDNAPKSHVVQCARLVEYLISNWGKLDQRYVDYYLPKIQQMCVNLGIREAHPRAALKSLRAAITYMY